MGIECGSITMEEKNRKLFSFKLQADKLLFKGKNASGTIV